MHQIGGEKNVFGRIAIYNLNILLYGMQRNILVASFNFDFFYLECNEKLAFGK